MSDPITIIGISAMSAILSLIVMGSLARSQLPGSVQWCAANALLALGMTLMLNRGYLPALLTVMSANGCIGMASALQLLGLRRFYRLPSGRDAVALTLVWVVMLFLIGYYQYVNERFAMRVGIFSVYHGTISCLMGWTVWYNRPVDRPKYAYVFMASIAGLSTVLNAVRGIGFLSGRIPETSLMSPTPSHIIFLAIGTMAAPALTIGMVMMAHDRMSAALERHANIDHLTNLLGRRAFIAAAENQCHKAKRLLHPMAVAFVDLDFFKHINDRHGHAIGDDVLIHFASILSTSMPSGVICGRIGGEEFAVLLPEIGDVDARAVLERMRTTLAAQPLTTASKQIAFTFSAGIAQLLSGESFEALMQRADDALYHAKLSGRNQTVLFDELPTTPAPAATLSEGPAASPLLGTAATL